MDDWFVPERVARSKSTGQYNAYVNGEWRPIGAARINDMGEKEVSVIPNLAEPTPTKYDANLITGSIPKIDVAAAKASVETPQEEDGFKPLRIPQELAASLMEGVDRGKVEERFTKQFGKVPEGYKVASTKEFLANRKTNPVTDPNNPMYYLVKKAPEKGFYESFKEDVSAIASNPTAAIAGFAKSIGEDPWQLVVPFVGQRGALATAANAARAMGAGTRTARAAMVAAGSINAAANIAAMNGAIIGAKQFGEGEFKPGELQSSLAISAPFALLGVRIKDAAGMVKKGTSSKQAAADVISWMEEQGVKASPDKVHDAIVNFPLKNRDKYTGALVDDIYNKVQESEKRIPTPPKDTMAEAMGTTYGKEMEKDLALGRYAKEAEQQYGGKLPLHETKYPSEPLTPEELGQTTPRIPEGSTPEVQPRTVIDPSTGVPMRADTYVKPIKEVIDYSKITPPEEGIVIPPTNASGESRASAEAISRVAKEKALGQDRFLIRGNDVIPLTGVDAVDTFAKKGEVIVQRNIGKEDWTVLDSDPTINTEGAINRAKASGLLPEKPTTEPIANMLGSVGTPEGGAIDLQLLKALGIGSVALAGYMNSDELPVLGAAEYGLTALAAAKLGSHVLNRHVRNLQSAELAYAEKLVQGKPKADIIKELQAEQPEMLQKAMGASKALKKSLTLPTSIYEARDMINAIKDPTKRSDIHIGAEKVLGILSTRIKNISVPMFAKQRKLEEDILGRTHSLLAKGDPFFRMLGESNIKVTDFKFKKEINDAILDNDFNKVEAILASVGNKKLTDSWEAAKEVLQDIGNDLETLQIIEGKRDDYFPRTVKDRKGMLEAMQAKEKYKLEGLLADANKAAIEKRNYPLNAAEENDVINKFLRGYPVKAFKPGYAKGRVFDVVPDELKPFYADNISAFHTYVRNSVNDIEKAKYFGKHYTKLKVDENVSSIDLNESIGKLLKEEMDMGKISQPQANELKSLLNSRFGAGEKSPNAVVQDVRNIISAMLIGNPVSAALQFSELGSSIFVNGMKPTLTALAKKLTGKSDISIKDFGLTDHISEEFANTRTTAKFLKSAFKLSGFTSTDKFTKDVFLQASLNRAKNLAENKEGVLKLKEKYGDVFGDKFQNLVLDLQKGTFSPEIKSMLFNELSDIQPISKSEFTQAYLDNPNVGRQLYFLKSFMVKQSDIIRNTAYNEYKKGNRVTALYNLTKYAMIMGSAGASARYMQDFIMGRDIEPSLEDIPLNFLKTFAWSEYTQNKLEKGKPVEVLYDLVLPPYKIVDKLLSSDEDDFLQFAPVVGKFYYQWFAGGIEKEMAKKEKEEKKKAKE